MTESLERKLTGYVEQQRDRLVEILRDLVRIPSENTPPEGGEGPCQRYAADVLRACGWNPELYELDGVAGLRQHKMFWNGRSYRDRPNLGATRKGTGGGRSLLLSGHMDTVPRGTQNWTREPFGGVLEDGRVFGRGANDMKAGIATNLFLAEALTALGVELRGDLTVESVVDEEFGGVNGTLAGRLKGFNADAAIIAEPSALRICPAQRGGRTVHLTLRAEGGILSDGKYPRGVAGQLSHLLAKVDDFAEQRRRGARIHPYFAGSPDPVPVSVTKIATGPWGMGEPVTVPAECKVEMYWQLMPGEERGTIDREFFAWLDGVVTSTPALFPIRPEAEFPIRWLPGSAMADSDPLVDELAQSVECALGERPPVVGMEGACDLFVFHSFGIPAALWGACGGNTHAADEYVEVESVVRAAKALLLFVCRWCGVDKN